MAACSFFIAEYLHFISIKTVPKEFPLPLYKQTNIKLGGKHFFVIIPFPAQDFCCAAQIGGSICPSVL